MRSLFAILVACFGPFALQAAPITATYTFNGTLAALESGVPALQAINPLGTGGFTADRVFGSDRTVYEFSGYPASDQQGGLVFSSAGQVVNPRSYSIEMVFQFFWDGGYRKVVDVSNRTSDAGLYVNWFGALDAYPVTNGLATLTANTYYHVVFTNDANGNMLAYVNGALDLEGNPSVMNLDGPMQVISFFLDNIEGGATEEYSSGRVALIRLYDGVLTPEEVAARARDSFGTMSIPEPQTLLLIGVTLALFTWMRKRGTDGSAQAHPEPLLSEPYWFDRRRS